MTTVVGADVAAAAPTSVAQAEDELTITVEPTSGLVSGDTVQVTVDGRPDATVFVGECIADFIDYCSYNHTFVPPGDRPVTVELQVGHLVELITFGWAFCLQDCVIYATTIYDDGEEAAVPIEVAPQAGNRLVVEPSTGLADGQQVGLRADGVPVTYDGPPFWIFPTTGHWTLAQCTRSIHSEPTILGVFRHCAAVPGRGEVAVQSPSADLGTAPVQASPTPILGTHPADCTEFLAQCVLALVRVERTGAVSIHPAPLTFA